MGPRRRLLTAAYLLVACGLPPPAARGQATAGGGAGGYTCGWLSPAARGQETQPTTTAAAPVEELPEEVLARLSTIEDFTYGFAHPGYYALLAFVKRAALAPSVARWSKDRLNGNTKADRISPSRTTGV